MIKGYSINSKRLEYIGKTIKSIEIVGRIDTDLKGNEAQSIIKFINNYSTSSQFYLIMTTKEQLNQVE